MPKSIPEKLFDDVIKNQIYTEQYANGLAKKIQVLLTSAQDEIVGQIAKIDPAAPTMTKWKQARLEKLNENISDILDSTFKEIGKESKTSLIDLGNTQSASTVNNFNKTVKADLFNVTLTPDNVKAIVENTMIDGKVIGDWWQNAKESTKTKMSAALAAGTQALQVGMVQGESIGELVNRIRGSKLTPGIMSVTKREATALVRTSVLQVANSTRQEIYKANADVLEGIQFVATLDNKTTPLCRAIDRKSYDMQMQPIGHSFAYPGPPPLHWQCRTTIVPLVKSWEQLAGSKSPLPNKVKKQLQNIPLGERASINGPVTESMTYNDWLLTQSIEEQQSILGQGKWKLWSENKLDMTDLIDNTGKELTLTQLQANLGDILAKKQVELENQLKKMALESANVEEFIANVKSFNKEETFFDQKGGITQFYAETKQTAETAKAARAEASLLKKINDPEAIVTFKPNQKLPIDLYKPVEGAQSAMIEGEKTIYGNLKTAFSQLPGETEYIAKEGYKTSSGMIVIDEQTGKIWLCSPKNQFGGYKNTFPKGTWDDFDASFGSAVKNIKLKEVAVKEVFEEAGLEANPIYHLGDYVKTTSQTRYYVGIKTGGNPTMMGWESEAVNLVPVNQLVDFLNVGIDKKIAEDFLVRYNEALKLGEGNVKKGFELLAQDKKAFVKFNESIITEEGRQALKWVKEHNFMFDQFPMKDRLAMLEDAIEKKSWLQEVGTVNGKLLSDLEPYLQHEITNLDQMIKGELGTLTWDAALPIWKEEIINIWNTLDTSVKKTYLEKWRAAGKSIPDELLSATDKKLLQEITMSSKTATAEYKITSLKQFKQIPVKSVNNMQDFYELKIDPKFIAQNQFEIEKIFSRNFNRILLKEYMGSPFESFDEFYSQKFGTKLITEETPKVLKNQIKIGKTSYDLDTVEGLAKYNKAKQFYFSDYVKSIAKGGKILSKTSQAFYDLASEEEKIILVNKIEKAKAKYKAAENVSIIPSVEVKTAGLNFEDMALYKGQAGSNKGGYYSNVNNPAERYYIKTPANEEIARNEMLASKLYQAAGTEVPNIQYIMVDGKKSIASSIIDGVENNSKILTSGKLRAGIYDDFVVDAWLANWDVVGLGYDNLLIKDGVRAVRIDVGGSLRFRAQGGAKGKDFGKEVLELTSLRNPNTNHQSASIFKNITQAELETGVKKVLSISDDTIKKLVDEFGPESTIEKDKLKEILIARKQYLREQFPNVKPFEEVKIFDAGTKSFDASEIKAIQESRINGKAIRFDKDEIEDQQIIFWTEKDVKGRDIVCAQMKVRGAGANKMDAFISQSDVSVGYNPSTIHDPIMEAIKGIAQQSRNDAALRAEKDIVRANKAIKTYYDEIAKLKSQGYANKDIVALQEHYHSWVEILENVVKKGAGNLYKLEQDTSEYIKNNLIQFKRFTKSAEEKVLFTKAQDYFPEKKLEKGYAKQTTNTLRRATEHAGRDSYVAEIDGVKVTYWPNNDSKFALQGMVQISVEGTTPDKMEKIISTLKDSLNINVARATATDKELLYLKQVLYARNDVFGQDLLEKLEGSVQKQILIIQESLSKKVRYDITKNANYNYDGISATLGTGKLNCYRPDLTGQKWNDFRDKYRLHHSLYRDPETIVDDLLNNGGELVSTTEKIRKGIEFGGKSPEKDLDTGGASYVFTRIQKADEAYSSYNGLVWKSDNLSRLDAISYPDDRYGRTTGNTVASHRKGTLRGWINNAEYSDNETIFKQSLSIFDKNFDVWVCQDQTQQKKIIKTFRDHGYTEWPTDGRKLEDVIIVRK